MPDRRSFLSLAALAAASYALPARAQERFSHFVGSSPDDVRRMIQLAGLRDGDTVIDLGSGDGRIVLAALRAHPGVRGIGVDIDASLVRKSRDAARALGLADRAEFHHHNAFDADLSRVDVIFMWLFPELMRLLRPKILAEARAGTRVVAATWDLGAWPPDAIDDVGGFVPSVRRWIVPARIEGGWDWEFPLRGRTYSFSALFEQRMQLAEGVVRVGSRREVLQHMTLRGGALAFSLRMTLPVIGHATLAFKGQVRGDAIEGSVLAELPVPGEDEAVDEVRVPWRARRSLRPAYFAPTGTQLGASSAGTPAAPSPAAGRSSSGG